MTSRAIARTATFAMGLLLVFALAIPAVASAAEANQPTVRFQMTAAIKNTKSLTTYPGKKTTLKVKVTNAKNPTITWSTTNARIATVNKKGVVTAKKAGRCYVKATVGKTTSKLLVEVTSEKAYQAVQNAFIDKQTRIAYNQAKRMDKYYRDCSAFVSRCYWDYKLNRRLFIIGGSNAKSWALPAADQAMWLNKKGKRVAWKAVSITQLRPGDTLYFETDYAGRDASQWRYIDHAAIYVGNGYVMDTSGIGGKGTIGFRWCKYYANDKSIKFIGRPCP